MISGTYKKTPKEQFKVHRNKYKRTRATDRCLLCCWYCSMVSWRPMSTTYNDHHIHSLDFTKTL